MHQSTIITDEILDFLVSTPTPEQIIAFHVSEEAQERLRTLLERNRAGTLTELEKSELLEMSRVDHFFTVLKAHAMKVLKDRNTEANIRVLEGLEPVRAVPGMYIGTDTGLKGLHAVTEILIEAAVDDAIMGNGSQVVVLLEEGNLITVSDDGEGLPITTDPYTKRPYLERFLATLSLANWPYHPEDAHHIFTQIPLATANGLADEMVVHIRKAGFLWQQAYSQGKPKTDLEKVRALEPDKHTGTAIVFKPDFTILQPNQVDYAFLHHRLRELSVLAKGINLRLEDKRSEPFRTVEFYYPNGVADYVRFLNRHLAALHDPIVIEKSATLERETVEITADFEIAIQYADTPQSIIVNFVNSVAIPMGGTHVEGALSALRQSINQYMKKMKLAEADDWYFFSDEDLTEGLALIVSVWYPLAVFEGARKTRLINTEIEDAVHDLVVEAFEQFSEQHSDQMERIVRHCLLNKAMRDKRRFGEP